MIKFSIGDIVVLHVGNCAVTGKIIGWESDGNWLQVRIIESVNRIDPSWSIMSGAAGEVEKYQASHLAFNKSQQVRDLVAL